MKRQKVAAIVPAYNEAANIGRVLDVLCKTPLVDEIIVVDDGSSDGTSDIAASYPIQVLRNKTNRGKAYSMDRGVCATDARIIFFCDADLRGLTPHIVADIIMPVFRGEYDMFIGVRNNVMQKAIKLFAINSGERSVTRTLWDEIPKYFKHRYRIEAGLNHIAKLKNKKVGWRRYPYYQTLKEKKYGVIKGTVLRWKMNADVGLSYGISALEQGQNIRLKAKDARARFSKR